MIASGLTSSMSLLWSSNFLEVQIMVLNMVVA